MVKRIALLGATGSIGESTLAVIAQNPTNYQIIAVSGFSQMDKLLTICLKFQPKYVSIPKQCVKEFQRLQQNNGLSCQILVGDDGLQTLAGLDDVDMVVAAIVGSAGLAPTLSAIKAGKTVLLANKESLVMAGDLMLQTAEQSGATLLPIDSEHNAIFQCLPSVVQQNRQAIHDKKQGIKRLWLTASGGPFLSQSFQAMQLATVTDAIKHPNWSMGKKISVDSATMMNKGLELIEASHLFAMPVDDIDVVIHPQSIIHSLVEYQDGSFLAQLGSPDMKTPIAHALAYPERIVSGAVSLDLFSIQSLTFLKPDLQKFKCLALAYQAMKAGAYASIALNASNEIAVAAFLQQRIRLTAIADINEQVLMKMSQQSVASIDDILAIDQQARMIAKKEINACPSYLPL